MGGEGGYTSLSSAGSCAFLVHAFLVQASLVQLNLWLPTDRIEGLQFSFGGIRNGYPGPEGAQRRRE